MLEVRENEIALRKLSGGTAHAHLGGSTASGNPVRSSKLHAGFSQMQLQKSLGQKESLNL